MAGGPRLRARGLTTIAGVTSFPSLASAWVRRPALPCPAQKADDPGKAVAAAERMAGQYAGIVVLEETSDRDQDIYAEPRLIRAIGNVPAEMRGSLAA